MSATSASEPLRSRRNHWNNHVAIHAQNFPDGTAVRYLGKNTSWRQLHERSQALAGALVRRGVRRGDRVLILMLNNPEYLETVLGVNALGAIAVPANFRLSPPELGFLAVDSGAVAVVTDSMLAPLAQAVIAAVPTLRSVVTVGADYEEILAESGTPLPEIDVPEDSPALIMYTSGTTGSPKGAVLSFGNLTSQSLTTIRANNSQPDDIAFLTSPLFHIAGLGIAATNLQLGIQTVLHPLGAFDAAEMLDAWEREQATSVFCVPAQWQLVCAEQAARPRDLALRVISWGAAPASDAVLRSMATVFPDAANIAVFGQTEMSPITCVLDGKDARRKLGSVGKPIPTIATRIVDDDGNDVAPGEVGEIVYRGPTLMQGYWNNPEATAEAFADGWFHSGDLVRRDEEGFVYVVDRKKDMIISGGENVYCAEVENALCDHPQIVEAAVIGRPDEKWGEIPIAVVATSAELTLSELEPFLNDRLARYKHPKALIRIDALPRNAAGKVIKHQLRQEYSV